MAPRRMPFLLWRKLGRILRLILLVIWVIGMSLHIEKVLWQYKLRLIEMFGSEVGHILRNIITYHLCIYMYRFIIKATRPAIFLRFAHLYTKYVQFINLCLRYVYSAHNQGLKTLSRVIFWINLNHDLYHLAVH